MKLLAVVFLALALVPSSARAVTLTYDDGTPAVVLEQWADAGFVPSPPGHVTVHRRVCYEGTPKSCTTAPGAELWLYNPNAVMLRSDLSHELGHIFDYRVMTLRARNAFKALIGARRPWRSAGDSPHEQFAEAYGFCFRHRAFRGTGIGAWASGYGYEPTPRLHRRVCRLIRRAAATQAAAASP